MGLVIAGMAMSLDGYINDRNGNVGRLYPDLDALRKTDILQEDIRTTGAVVMGRGAYDMAQGDFTGYEFQVPIFVLTHDVPQKVTKGENQKLKFTFLTDGIESAIRQAKAAAGDRGREYCSAITEGRAGGRIADRSGARPVRRRDPIV